MIAIKNILVATDFSEPSELALAYGRNLARTFQATLHILHVAESAKAIANDEPFALSINVVQADIENAAWRQLDRLLTVNEILELRVQKEVQTSSSPSAAITDYAATHEIDLIVMGTHGRNAFSRLLMGSVAERVVRSAPCPVLTVRSHQRDLTALGSTTAAATG